MLDAYISGSEHGGRPENMTREHEEWTSTGRQLTSTYRDLVNILREQLQAAQERERDYREYIARLTAMLDQAHQQNQRLLDMPRTTPPPRPAPRTRLSPPGRERTPGATPPAGTSPGPPPTVPLEAPRGDMRRRIVAPAPRASRGARACRDAVLTRGGQKFG